MKKWIAILVGMGLVFAISSVTNADEQLWGNWKCKNSEGSIIYIFKPEGQGLLRVVSSGESPSSQNETTFLFFYIIDRKIVASSSIDSFREYLAKIWFPSLDLTGTMRIFFRKDGKSIEVSELDGAKKLILTR